MSFTSIQKRALFLSSLGGVLEYYDFIIYIFLAPMLEKIFFADNSAEVAILKTLAIFSIGYLLRPLGGIIFSHFGDRYGRKVVFLLTVVFMALPSFGIGLLPTPAQIGIASPILLLLLRMMQGLALGGEIPAAITFVAEHAPDNRRGFALATLFFGINMGLMLGSFSTTVLTSMFTTSQIIDYAWRILFLIGGICGLASVFVRRYLHETAAFSALKKEELQRIPFVTLIKQANKQVIQGMLLVSIGCVSVFLYLYFPQYLHQYFHYNYDEVMRINTLSVFLMNINILIGGWMVDRFGGRIVYLIITACLAVCTYPLFLILNNGSTAALVFVYFAFSMMFGFIPASYCDMISRLFPTSIRYSGVAASYNIAFAFFGGLSPVICTLVIQIFGSPFAPAGYMAAIAVLCCLSCYFGKRIFSHREEKITPSSLVETVS